MDARFFLTMRTNFIRYFYDHTVQPFLDIKTAIQEQLPPFESPPYSEDDEPAFMAEWIDATTAEQISGMSAVSLLSDSLKLYFHTLQHDIIRFAFDEKKPFKNGFVPAYLNALGEILDTDWSDCPANVKIIEQIVLVRNRGQHGGDLTSFSLHHDYQTLIKHPVPLFANVNELKNFTGPDPEALMFFNPAIEITRANLFSALEHVDVLAEWIEGRMDKAYAWQKQQRLKNSRAKN